MESVNDLLRVVICYGTTPVTLKMLTYFIPLDAYGGVWKTKARVESRGLLLDDVVVGDAWYPYYLLLNRTFNGILMEFKLKPHKKVESRYLDDDVIFHRWLHFDSNLHLIIKQTANLDVKVSNKTIRNFGRKIRDVCAIGNLYEKDFVVLDEYGDVWLYAKPPNYSKKEFIKLASGLGVVYARNNAMTTFSGTIDDIVMLDRDGALWRRNETLNLPKIAHIAYNYLANANHTNNIAIEPSGREFVVYPMESPVRVEVIHGLLRMDKLHSDENETTKSYYTILGLPLQTMEWYHKTVGLLGEPMPSYIIAGCCERSVLYMTPDRTAYFIPSRTNYPTIELPETKNKTQLIDGYIFANAAHTGYVILDHSQS